mmetsp:Transcript_47006/g.87568  ORF Transcript_47006/g.87568 Transcript_47006/m.87568 type:complete len:108 (+) Transcript_47006:76-399(+)
MKQKCLRAVPFWHKLDKLGANHQRAKCALWFWISSNRIARAALFASKTRSRLLDANIVDLNGFLFLDLQQRPKYRSTTPTMSTVRKPPPQCILPKEEYQTFSKYPCR